MYEQMLARLGSRISQHCKFEENSYFYHSLGGLERGISYTLLDDTHLVISRASAGMLHVFRFNPHNKDEGSNDVDLERPVVILHLLAGSKACQIQDSSIPRPPSWAPFWPDPALQVTAVHYYRYSPHTRKGHHEAPSLLLIPYATWRSLIDWADSSPSNRAAAVRGLEWNKWAQQDTLLLTVDIDNGSLRGFNFVPTWTYGSRVCVLLERNWETRPVLVFDLNSWAAKYARHVELLEGPLAAVPAHGDQKWAEQWREHLCVSRAALLPYAVYHGPKVTMDSSFRKKSLVVATHSGFMTVVGLERTNWLLQKSSSYVLTLARYNRLSR